MNDNLHTYIEPELEARITALVLGEASEFEVDELERLIEEKPELAIFQRRVEVMHQLLGDAMLPQKDDQWQLSDERRATLKKTFSQTAPGHAKKAKIKTQSHGHTPIWKKQIRAAVVIAACVMLCLILFMMATPVVMKSEKTAFESQIASYSGGSEVDDNLSVRGDRRMVELETALPQEKIEGSPSPIDLAARTPGRGRGYYSKISEKKGAGKSITDGDVMATEALFKSKKKNEVARQEISRSVERKPSMPSSSMAKVIASNTNSPTAVPVPEVNVPDLSADYGNGGDFGDGWGGGRADGRKVSGGFVREGEAEEAGTDPFAAPEEDETLDLNDKDSSRIKKDSKDRSTSLHLGESDRIQRDSNGKNKHMNGTLAKRSTLTIPSPDTPKALPDETTTSTTPFSTFSLNVADVSFKLAKVALLEKGQWPDAAKVRTEEFVNAFDYGDPSPRRGEPVACVIEQSAHPFLQQRNLLRVGMKTASIGRSAPLRLTILLDNSGSMEREDREASVLAAMQVLASQLGPQDVITVVGFARQPRLLADRISGDKAHKLVEIVANTPSEGGTNLEEALSLARTLAKRQHTEGAQDRVVLITDGVANLGNTIPEELSKQIVAMRQEGVAFDACGVGAEGLNDDILEALTRKGDGRYYFLNRAEDADSGFAKQLAGALTPAAKNVKVQVKFNPNRVTRYRLLGFEKHRLKKEDFRNDKVDAAEMAAEEAGNAVYQIQVNPQGVGELGVVFVRFLDASTGRMVERSWPLPYEPQAPPFDLATPSMQLAGTAAMLGEKLHGTDAGSVRFPMISNTLNKLSGHFASDPKVMDLIRMCRKVK